MRTHRRAEITIGILYIVAAVTAVLGLYFYQPILMGSDYLTNGAAHKNQIVLGAFMELLLVCSAIGTAVGLFPFVRKYNESIALAYLCFRFLEAVIITIGILAVLSLLTVSESFISAASINGASFMATGTALIAIHDWTFMLGPDFMLGLNTFLYSSLLYTSRLVPRPLAALGLVGATLVFVAALLELFGVIQQVSTVGGLLALPVFVYEMSLAVWLIFRGFNASTLTLAAENPASLQQPTPA